MTGFTFYLTTHMTNWLHDGSTDVPLMVSAPRLARTKRLRPATTDWVLDSGGFSELTRHGTWTTGPEEYCAQVARYCREIGRPRWAATQDWMCEPAVRWGEGSIPGTKLTVAEHQRRTVQSWLDLTTLWPQHSDDPHPFIPVLQGWTAGEYSDCVRLYEAAGVDLAALPVVGLGSVCRRQNALSIALIAGWLAQTGLKLHGFGVKTDGLAMYGADLVSSDSAAWSYHATKNDGIPGHTHRHCGNCLEFALQWREGVLDGYRRPACLGGAA